MEEINIFNTLVIARIGNGIGVIALILFGWLALRYANAVRESGDARIIHKVLGSVFALAGGFAGYSWSIESQNCYVRAANALNNLKASGTEISNGARVLCLIRWRPCYFCRSDRTNILDRGYSYCVDEPLDA